MKYDYKCVVIGAGSGGLAFIDSAAALGLNNIALVEKDERLGGECLHYGCVPSKALIHAAKEGYAEPFKHVKSSIKRIEKRSDNCEYVKSLGIKTYVGEAHFVDKHTILVGGKKIAAKYFVIATGSGASVPPIEGLDEGAYLTNENLFDLKSTPKSMVIMGGGPTGCEMASAFSDLGTRVTLLERGPRILNAIDDEEASKILEKKLRSKGVSIIPNCPEYVVEWSGSVGRIDFKKSNRKAITFDEILVSTGRKPNTHLSLDAAKIKHDAVGIKVNKNMRTNKRNIYAIGDCTPGPKFTHLAAHQANIVLTNMMTPIYKQNASRLVPTPAITYTTPEIGTFGISVTKASYDESLRVVKHELDENDRAVTDEGSAGYIKLVIDKKGKLKGGVVVADNASEILAPLLTLFYVNRKFTDLKDVVLPYPTLAFSLSHMVSSEVTSSIVNLPGWSLVSRAWRK